MTKFVLRVLDGDGVLLGWAELQAEARGDGRLWARGPTAVAVTTPGTPAALSLHWVDINVEVRRPWPHAPVSAGEILTLTWEQPLLVVGEPAGGLPPVTVGTAVVSMPVGALGAVTR